MNRAKTGENRTGKQSLLPLLLVLTHTVVQTATVDMTSAFLKQIPRWWAQYSSRRVLLLS